MPSERSRRKALAAARPNLHPTSAPLAYSLAVGGTAPNRTQVLVVVGAVAAGVGLSLLAGGLAGPGWLFFASFWAFNPPRAVVTTGNSVVLFDRSILNGRPTRVRAVAALDSLLAPPVAKAGRWSGYAVGDEVVWMTRPEAARAVDTVRAMAAAAAR